MKGTLWPIEEPVEWRRSSRYLRVLLPSARVWTSRRRKNLRSSLLSGISPPISSSISFSGLRIDPTHFILFLSSLAVRLKPNTCPVHRWLEWETLKFDKIYTHFWISFSTDFLISVHTPITEWFISYDYFCLFNIIPWFKTFTFHVITFSF